MSTPRKGKELARPSLPRRVKEARKDTASPVDPYSVESTSKASEDSQLQSAPPRNITSQKGEAYEALERSETARETPLRQPTIELTPRPEISRRPLLPAPASTSQALTVVGENPWYANRDWTHYLEVAAPNVKIPWKSGGTLGTVEAFLQFYNRAEVSVREGLARTLCEQLAAVIDETAHIAQKAVEFIHRDHALREYLGSEEMEKLTEDLQARCEATEQVRNRRLEQVRELFVKQAREGRAKVLMNEVLHYLQNEWPALWSHAEYLSKFYLLLQNSSGSWHWANLLNHELLNRLGKAQARRIAKARGAPPSLSKSFILSDLDQVYRARLKYATTQASSNNQPRTTYWATDGRTTCQAWEPVAAYGVTPEQIKQEYQLVTHACGLFRPMAQVEWEGYRDRQREVTAGPEVQQSVEATSTPTRSGAKPMEIATPRQLRSAVENRLAHAGMFTPTHEGSISPFTPESQATGLSLGKRALDESPFATPALDADRKRARSWTPAAHSQIQEFRQNPQPDAIPPAGYRTAIQLRPRKKEILGAFRQDLESNHSGYLAAAEEDYQTGEVEDPGFAEEVGEEATVKNSACACHPSIPLAFKQLLKRPGQLDEFRSLGMLQRWAELAGGEPKEGIRFCYAHTKLAAGKLGLKLKFLTHVQLAERLYYVFRRVHQIHELKTNKDTYQWFRRTHRPWHPDDGLGVYAFHPKEPEPFRIEDREALLEAWGLTEAWNTFQQDGTVNIDIFGDVFGDEKCKRTAQLEFDMYKWHLREDKEDPNFGWLRNMYHSLTQQLVRSDLMYYIVYVLFRPDLAWRLISHPYYAKYAQKGDSTFFRHIDVSLHDLRDYDKLSNMIQGSVSLDDETEANCTEVVKGGHRWILEWFKKRELRTGPVHHSHIHAILNEDYTAEDKAEFGDWERVPCKSGEIRITYPQLMHGSTSGANKRQRRTILPWFMKVEDDHQRLENIEAGTWEDLARAHQSGLPARRSPSGKPNIYGTIPFRFPGSGHLWMHPIGEALNGRRRWDDPMVMEMVQDVFNVDKVARAKGILRETRKDSLRSLDTEMRNALHREEAAYGEKSYWRAARTQNTSKPTRPWDDNTVVDVGEITSRVVNRVPESVSQGRTSTNTRHAVTARLAKANPLEGLTKEELEELERASTESV